MLFLRIMLFPFLPVYKIIIGIRNFLFNKGFFKSHKVGARVISVGNITTGGSGKTPMVIYLANLLKENGERVGVLSRGYGRKSSGYFLVSDGEKIYCSVEKCGDEIYLTAMECRVPSAVCENRVTGAKRFLNEAPVDIILLDDAFQHRWISRDIDIVLLDQRFLNKVGGMDQNLLPLGVMRENFASLKRADAVIINRKFSEELPIPGPLLTFFEGKKVFTAYYSEIGIYDLKDQRFYEMSEFHGQKSLVVSGIARPYSFLNILSNHNIDIKNKIIFRDHKKYSLKDIQQIRKLFYSTNSHSVITTAKDAVKLTEFSKELDDIDIYYLKIKVNIDQEEEFRKFIFDNLRVS